jgi:hypothetical protein
MVTRNQPLAAPRAAPTAASVILIGVAVAAEARIFASRTSSVITRSAVKQ